MYKRNEIIFRVCGIVSGILLGLPNLIGVFAPVQLVAFLPILLCVRRWKFGPGMLITAGTYMALGYIVPQMFVLRMPPLIIIILILDFVVVMSLLLFAANGLLREPTVLRCFAFAGVVVVLDWLNYTAIPMWGTAQAIVRSWSAWRYLIAYTSVTGMGGIVFIIVLVQTAAVCMRYERRRDRRMLKAIGVTVGVFVVVNLASLIGKPVETIRVAAVGWNRAAVEEYGDPHRATGFEKLFAEPVRNAAKQGAKLVVSPEMGFYIDEYEKDVWLEMVSAVALANNVYLAVGYFDAAGNNNQMLLVDNTGRVVDIYAKTYLTPFESSNRGDGQPKIIQVGGVKTGAMICHDDNYTSISRRYGRALTGLVAVPTLDWKAVRYAHMQSCIHRTIESRYALVRAAYDGISAVISPRGKVIASFDHITDGAGMIVADVEVYNQRTVFSYAGDWFVLASAIFFVGYIISFKWLTKRRNPV